MSVLHEKRQRDLFLTANETTFFTTENPDGWTALTVVVDGRGDANMNGATVRVYGWIGGVRALLGSAVTTSAGPTNPINVLEAVDAFEVSVQALGATSVETNVAIIAYGTEPAQSPTTLLTLAGDATGPSNANTVGSLAGGLILASADAAQGAGAALVFGGAGAASVGIVRIPYTAGTQIILNRRVASGLADAPILSVIGTSNLILGDSANQYATLDIYAVNVALIGLNNNYFNSPNHVFSTYNGIETARFSPVNSGANVFLFATTNASNTIKQADNVTNGATGAPTTIQAQNATGTTSTGGDLTLAPGTGTTSNGKLNFANAITGLTVGAAGAGAALPATPTGYWTVKINGVAQRIPYYA